MIHFIGDIHGHATELEELLLKLGYSRENGVYAHPSATAFFVGDFIDRGPQVREVLQIVKPMCDAGFAKTVMGNHEYNALCFHHQDHAGNYLRRHTAKNMHQHSATLEQFKDHPEEWQEYLEWFLTLPLFYEEDGFRVVHACWDSETIVKLRKTLPNNQLTKDILIESADKSTQLYSDLELTLKGREIELPDGIFFHDKDGVRRENIRIKWWENTLETPLNELSVHPVEGLPTVPSALELAHYLPEDKPVFFGHYWLNGLPQLYRGNICCLDYSVAKGGKLVAYRWNGEQELKAENLVFV